MSRPRLPLDERGIAYRYEGASRVCWLLRPAARRVNLLRRINRHLVQLAHIIRSVLP